MKLLRLLNVDDDDVDQERFARLVTGLPWDVDLHCAATLEAASELLGKLKFDCVFLDYHLGGALGFELIPLVREHREEVCPIIMLSMRSNEDLVVEAMREGIYDYISKTSLDLPHLQRSISGSLHWAERETALGKYRDRMEHLSLYDALTGLPNRTLVFERLDQMVLGFQRHGQPFALLMMDLNLFKEVNDTLGHDAGDEVLRQVAQRLQSTVRKSDTVARLGGDEFACLVPGVKDTEGALVVAEKITAAMRSPMLVEEQAVTVGISVGAALFPLHGDDGRTLLKRADQAMYRAKQGAKGAQICDETIERTENPSVLLASALEKAIENGEILLHYQPQVELDTHRIIGKEALVRWQHPIQGMMAPIGFIPAAEKSPVIAALTDAVLRIALDEERKWRQQGVQIPISVNVSARLLDDGAFATRVVRMLGDRALPAECLILELTETALVASPVQAMTTLRAMSQAGIRISIDDFGSGYTSFRQLRELEVSEIKIDGTYVTDVTREGRDASIVRSIVELGRGFNIHVIAECVEHEKTWSLLQQLGCRSAQGFSIGRPMPSADFDQWRSSWMEKHPQLQ
jgi:diguanylate cyclase (GGDEF)-like protein